MKAITILQPWASLMAYRVKTIETRSWPIKYRGPLAIHAGKSTKAFKGCKDYFTDEQRRSMMMHLNQRGIEDFDQLPLGAVVCIVELVDCIQVEKLKGEERNERYFGDYSPGRFAWKTEFKYRFGTPRPFKGMQGLWNWPGPFNRVDSINQEH